MDSRRAQLKTVCKLPSLSRYLPRFDAIAAFSFEVTFNCAAGVKDVAVAVV